MLDINFLTKGDFMKKALFKSFLVYVMACVPSFVLADNYRFVSGPQGGNWFVLGGAISSYFSKDGLATSSSTGGGVTNVVNINRKKADVGFSVGSLLGAAAKGEGKFKKPIKNAVVLANLYPQVTYFIARTDFVKKHNIKTLGDALKIKNLRIASLKPGSSSEFVVSSLFKLAYKTDWKKIKKEGGEVQFASYSDGAGLIGDNHIDLFAFSVGEIASVIMNIESQTDITILPVEKAALAKLSEAYGTGVHTIKPGIYKSVKKDIDTVGDFTICVVRKDLPKEVVKKMAQSLLNHKKELQNTIKDFSYFAPNHAIAKTLPMHEGSKEFFASKLK